MSAPSLTVLMPVYNAATHLEDAIASVLAQSFEDFELLLMDDGSTDESMEVVRGFRDKRIRIESQATNLGLAQSRLEQRGGEPLHSLTGECGTGGGSARRQHHQGCVEPQRRQLVRIHEAVLAVPGRQHESSAK